jgi:NADH-quinone oxidoreductase subunit K
MNGDYAPVFWVFNAFLVMIGVAGLYCMLVSHNLIRILIGIEILIKAITLFLVLVGNLIHRTALAQALVINLIVFEVFFITVACGVVLSIYKHTQSLDTEVLRKLKSGGAAHE